MKLYKFRSLASCCDHKRAREILETGKFWCSRFWELNDPMEGIYWFNKGTLTDKFIQNVYTEKSNHVICSFSGEEAFEKPIMWGYYANGFKGIAIEIEVGCGQASIEPVTYAHKVAKITDRDETTASVKRILTTKLSCWQHENEYRYLQESDCNLHPIGTITAVYFGNPYKTTVNAKDAQKRPCVKDYLYYVESLKQMPQVKNKCHQVDVVNGLVRVADPTIKNDSNL
jgi:hypothetical protein